MTWGIHIAISHHRRGKKSLRGDCFKLYFAEENYRSNCSYLFPHTYTTYNSFITAYNWCHSPGYQGNGVQLVPLTWLPGEWPTTGATHLFTRVTAYNWCHSPGYQGNGIQLVPLTWLPGEWPTTGATHLVTRVTTYNWCHSPGYQGNGLQLVPLLWLPG